MLTESTAQERIILPFLPGAFTHRFLVSALAVQPGVSANKRFGFSYSRHNWHIPSTQIEDFDPMLLVTVDKERKNKS